MAREILYVGQVFLHILSRRLRDRVRRIYRKVVVGALAGAVGACGSSSAPPTTPGDAEPAVCPSTPEDTVGKHCGVEGLVCGPQYACGIAQVSLYCVCTRGTFQCRNGENGAVDADATLPCNAGTKAPGPCPPSEAVANMVACGTVGQICAYPSQCGSMFDTCSCFPGNTADGGFGPVFVCKPAVCGSDAGPPDARP